MPHSIDMEEIRGALAFLTVREGITVLQLSDATETAALLRIMERHAQERIGQLVSLREPRPQIEELYAAYLVEGLPGVARAERICCWRTLPLPLRSYAPQPRSCRRYQISARRAPSASGRRFMHTTVRNR